MKIWTGAAVLSLAMGMALAQKPDEQGSTAKPSKASNPSSTEGPRTRTYKGTLVAASCGGGATLASNTKAKKSKGEANRSAEDSSQSCSPSSNATEFGLKTKDGRVYAFDPVGNARAQEAMRQHKEWEKRASAGKPVRVEVGGMEDNGKLMAVTIDPIIQ